MREMSTLCSAAIWRTSCVDLVRSRCSAVWTPPPSPLLTGAGASGLGVGGVDVAFGSAFGGGAGAGAAAFGGSGFVGAGAAEPFSVSSTATNVWTGTVCPSCTLISANTPAAGAGISASTLSVEISNSGSSRLTVSPTFLSHLLKVPSAIDSPICGINTSTRAIFSPSVGREPSCGFHNIVSLGQHEVLERRRIWQRHVVCRHPHDRPVEPLERLLVEARGDLARDATGPRVLVHDQHLIRLLHRRDDRRVIEREQRPQIEHLDRHAVFLVELVGGFQRFPQRGAVTDDGKMLAFACHPRLPDRRENFFALGQLFLDTPIQPFVLEIQDGIVIADGSLNQPLRVPDRRGIHNFEPRRVQERRLRVL